jgi:hypothetical protein
MYICMYIYMYVCMYLYVCMYVYILCIQPSRAEASYTSTRETFSGRVIHKIFHAAKFKSFLKSKKLLLINSTKVTSMSNFVDI